VCINDITAIDGFNIEESFPAIITSHQKLDYAALVSGIEIHRDAFHELLLKLGALLFRGFPIASRVVFHEKLSEEGLV
jgi:hypothetical protein